ncbi:MAG: hypothetical protein GX757_12275 [Clostridiales bacterium]|nr:hypothetical protein [Clostridiales bacterium]
MRKNFFKKLSFVLALAMIVSVIAPAAGVFADTGLKLNSKDKTLHLAQPGKKNKFNFNIDGEKQKGWKYLWISSNEDVAEVNEKNGVTTAVGTGTAEITVVITDKNGAEVDRLTAKVTVKDNIKTVAIKNPPTEPIPVGEEYDFNRSFVTYSGSTTKTTAVTRWSVEGDNKDKATINEDNGVFKASEAGTYTVVARAFQSKAKYNEWKETGDASLVLDEASAEIIVKIGLESVKQTTLNKFVATFDSDLSKTDLSAETAQLYRVINGVAYQTGTEKIKELKVEGKTATVELYADFAQEADYKFVYGDLEQTFKTAKVALTEVTEIRFDDFDVTVYGDGVDMNTKVSGYNKDGVQIYAPAASSEFTSNLSFKYEGEDTKGYVGADDKLYLFEKGYTAKVTATFEYYYYNSATNTYEPIKHTDDAIARGVETDLSLNQATLQYALATSKPADDSSLWAGAKTVPAEDGGFKIYTRYKKNNASGANDPYKVYAPDEDGDTDFTFEYESTNPDKLLIAGNSLWPVAQGTVTVLVKKVDETNKTVVGSFDVLIQGKRQYLSAVPSTSYVVVGNNTQYGETAQVTISSKDTMNDAITSYSNLTYAIDRKPSDTAEEPEVSVEHTGASNDASLVTVSVSGKKDGATVTPGAYVIKVTLEALGGKKEVFFTVNVLEGNNAGENYKNVVKWQLELDSEVDLRNTVEKTVTISVYGYNSNNVRVAKLKDAQYDIEIKKSNGSPLDSKFFNDTALKVVQPVSGDKADAIDKDTYLVTAKVVSGGSTHPTKRQTGAVIQAKQITVKDTTPLDKKVVSLVVNPGTVFQMTKDAFDFKVNTDDFNASEDNIVSVSYTTGSGTATETTADATQITSGNSVRINSVTFRLYTDTTYVDYTVNVGITIKAK